MRGTEWVETAWSRRIQFIDKNLFPMNLLVYEWMSAAESASEASIAEQADECAVRTNQRADERVARYYMRRFHSHSTHCAAETS